MSGNIERDGRCIPLNLLVPRAGTALVLIVELDPKAFQSGRLKHSTPETLDFGVLITALPPVSG